MKNTKLLGRFLTSSLSLAAALIVASPAYSQFEMSLIETGTAPNTSIALRVRAFGDQFAGVNQLVAPSGDVFTRDQDFPTFLTSNLLRNFNSLSDALAYVEGGWRAVSPPAFGQPQELDFSIAVIPTDKFIRTAPQLLATTPNAVIKNNTAFNFSFDYPTNGGPLPDQTNIGVIPQYSPLSSSGGFRVGPGSTFPLGSYTTGTGDHQFSGSITNISGADENNFLITFGAATAALPLNVQITLGSYIDLHDFIANQVVIGNPIFGSRVSIFYSRQNDPFNITLSTVPEPSSLGIAIVAVIGSCALLSRNYSSR